MRAALPFPRLAWASYACGPRIDGWSPDACQRFPTGGSIARIGGGLARSRVGALIRNGVRVDSSALAQPNGDLRTALAGNLGVHATHRRVMRQAEVWCS